MSKDIQSWKEQEFLPWKAAMQAYMDERQQQVMRLKAHAGALQSIVALLCEGRTRQALLAWNTLELKPKLKDLRVSGNGESLSLVATDGKVTVLMLDDVIAELDALLKA